jgi:citrate lyase subunit beta / citryl-CoA lyase
MDQAKERTIRPASAGLDDRQDIIVRIFPVEREEDGTGISMECVGDATGEIEVDILRSADSTDSGMVRRIVNKAVGECRLSGVRIEVLDQGAEAFVIRARTLAACHRASIDGRGGQVDQLGFQGEVRDSIDNDGTDGSGCERPEDRLRRSRIYIPGNRPRMIAKAEGFGADVIILDLEDSVPPSEKDSARFLVAEALLHRNFGSAERMVRINPLSTCGAEDIAAIIPSGPDAIVLPKCEEPRDIHDIERLINEIHCMEDSQRGEMSDAIPTLILPLIETARGVMNAHAIAACSPRVIGLSFGGEDFSRDIGAERTVAGEELFLARSMLVLAAKAAGKQALDTIFADVKDTEGLRRDAARMRKLGFNGKGAIHPAQIPVIHEVYSPSRKELQHAVDVVAAARMAELQGSGIAVLKGKMIDVPVIKRAEKVIAIAERIGLEVPVSSEPNE